MPWTRRISGCVAWMLLGAAVGLAQEKSGLLLTVTSTSGDSQQRFHSYWIARDGAQVQVTDGMRLLVPRKAGWWEIGILGLTRMNSSARSEIVVAAPLGAHYRRSHVIPVSDDNTCPDEISTYSVSWVGSDFAALHHAYESSCGAHPVSGEESFMVKLESLRREDEQTPAQLKLSEAAGESAVTAMKLGADVANTRAAQKSGEDDGTLPIVANENSWLVIRSKGHYHLLGTTSMEHGQGGDSYDVPLDPPQLLVGGDALAVGWDAVLDKVPDATDAYTSPDGDLAVVVNSRYVSVFVVRDKKIDKRLARFAIESASVIAAQWSTGANVDRWNETLVPLLKATPPSSHQ